MKKLRILIDIDGIVADTLPAWLGQVGRDTGVVAKISDITQYDLTKCPPLDKLKPEQIFDVLQKPGFTTHLPLMTGADLVLKNLMNDGHEVYLVTARSGATHVAETFQWIAAKLPFIDVRRQLVFLYDKHLLSADVIIDDKGATLTKYKQTHPNALVLGISYPYNTYLEYSSDIADRNTLLVEYGDAAWVTLYQQILLHSEYYTRDQLADKCQASIAWLRENFSHIWYHPDISAHRKTGFLAACCDSRRCFLATLALPERMQHIYVAIVQEGLS